MIAAATAATTIPAIAPGFNLSFELLSSRSTMIGGTYSFVLLAENSFEPEKSALLVNLSLFEKYFEFEKSLLFEKLFV